MQAKGLYQAGNMEAAKAFNNMADAYELLANEYGRLACQAGLGRPKAVCLHAQ